jgi:DegV family protein with EDD domain
VDIFAEEFYRRLPQSNPLPTTSQCSPGEMAEVYRRALAEGEAVLSLHISARLSGTYNSALLGREQVLEEWRGRGAGDNVPQIQVVDSQWVSMGLGYLALAAARAARRGASLSSLASLVAGLGERMHICFLVDTLEYLVKGGRIGKAQSLLGTLLRIKPLLEVRDGEVLPLERVRTFPKAVQRLQDLATQAAPLEALAVLYTTTPAEAGELADRLRPHVPSGEVYLHQIGPVIGVHGGPGLLGVMWVDRPR